MGTLEEQRSGFIYLQEEVLSSFSRVLASTDYISADTFLEHLIAVFEGVASQTCAIKVRDDVAQRFISLKCETRFQTSNDLMKHLLQLHIQLCNKSPPETSKNDASNDSPVKERSHPRKRKSQPKRNVNHSWHDSNSVNKSPVQNGTADANLCEMSVSSVEDSEMNHTKNGDTVFDLSKVKQEVVEDTDDVDAAKSFTKDPSQNIKPLCLALQKPGSARDALDHGFAKNNTDSSLCSKHNVDDLSVIKAGVKGSRKVTQLNWRSEIVEKCDSECKKSNQILPPGQSQILKPYSPPTSQKPALPDATDKTYQLIQEKNSMDDDCNGYNYVLNSFDASPGLENNRQSGLRESVMELSEKDWKSTPYTLMSGEDSVDLSLNNEMSRNSIMFKANEIKDEKLKLSIKYDRNGNTLSLYPMAKLPNGQAQIAVPQNLLFCESQRQDNQQLVEEPQKLQISQASRIVTESTGTKMVSPSTPRNQSVMFFSGQLPQLQLFNICSPPPLYANSKIFVQTGAVSQAVKSSSIDPPPPLIPVSASVVPTGQKTPLVLSKPKHDLVTGNWKRRKRMQDPAGFRDPPEQSLPFNGPNKFRFYCDICETGFARRYTFNRHKCKGKVEKHYCQLCDKSYLSKYKLKDHILVKHEGQTVDCPDCGKHFSSRSSMEMHKKQQHEGLYSIFCKVCGKGFNHTGHYYGHMNKHTNTKPFWCQQCGKRFYGSSYLHNHKQVCRENELNLSCTACDRKFKCELYLKKHMKIHNPLPIIADPSVAKSANADLTIARVSVVADELKADEDSMERDDMDKDVNVERNQLVLSDVVVEDFSDSILNSGTLVISKPEVLPENAVRKNVNPL